MKASKNSWVILLAVVVIALAGCSGKTTAIASQTTAVPSAYRGKAMPPNVDANAGAALYQTDCVPCHGAQGHGDGPASVALNPRPANLVKLSRVSADDFLYWKIGEGVDGSAMPAWKGILTDEQIWQVVAFVRTLK